MNALTARQIYSAPPRQFSVEELELSPVQRQLRRANLDVMVPIHSHNAGDSYCRCETCVRERSA